MDYKDNLNFKRAGEILITIIWLEKRLVDCIILRQSPGLKEDFNNGTISQEHADLRIYWHKQELPFISEKFLEVFPEVFNTDPKHNENLLFLGQLRNLLSHGDISCHRNNILFVPKDEKRSKKFDEITRPNDSGHNDGTKVVNLIDENKYNTIKLILRDIEKIIESIASFYGVDPIKFK